MDVFFWNKYKPVVLKDIKHNGRSITFLQKLTEGMDGHLYLTGITTEYVSHVARLFIRETNGGSLTMKKTKFVLTPSITVELDSSDIHYEFDMNYYKYMRRDIPLLIIENIVRHKNISNNSFHIVLISNVHLMTFTVQAAFRRLMEKYVRSCRFIFVNKNRNGIIDALRSRCLHLSFIKPGFIQYRQMLEHIAGCESLDISDEIYEKVYEHSNGIIDGVNLLQLYSLNKKAIDYKEKYSPYNEIVFYIRKGDIRYFKKIQEILFTLHSLDVSFTDVIKNILKKIIGDKGTSDKKKIKATSIAADCDWRCVKSNREIVQLNLFIGRLIELYQKKI